MGHDAEALMERDKCFLAPLEITLFSPAMHKMTLVYKEKTNNKEKGER